MPAALVTSYTGSNFSGSGTTVSVTSVVVAAGDLVVIEIGWRLNAAQTVGTPTFGGSSTGIAVIAGAAGQTGEGSGAITAFRGIGLTPGTQNIVVTWSANSPVMMVRVLVISGADQATPIGTVVQTLGSGADPITCSATVGAGGLGIDQLLLRNDNVLTASGGQQNTNALGIGQGTQMDTACTPDDGSSAYTGNVGGDTWVFNVIPVNSGGPVVLPLPVYPNNRHRMAAFRGDAA